MGELINREILFSDPQMDLMETTAQRVLGQMGVGCFTKDTLVQTINGHKPISEIDTGELVLSLNQITKQKEYKPVVNKFEYKSGVIGQNMITFNLVNGLIIKCTENHGFYIEGNWVPASVIAERSLANSREHKQSILHKQHGAAAYNKQVSRLKSFARIKVWVYESSKRFKWLFENVYKSGRKIYNCKNTQIGCSGIHYKSEKETLCESYKRNKERQSIREFGVVYYIRKYYSFFQNRIAIKHWFKAPEQQINGGCGEGNKDIVEKTNRSKLSFRAIKKIFSFVIHSAGFNQKATQGLASREIRIDEIESFSVSKESISVYDLAVDLNDNYCVTTDNIIVHNSGKSHCIGMIAFDFVSKNPEVRGFIGANTYGQLTKSTLDRVFKVWDEVYGLVKGIHYVVDRIPPESFVKIGPMLKTYENTISFNNGGLIFVASLDNYKVIDGTEFGWALLDETKDTREEAVKEVIVARLRQLGMMVGTNGVIYKTRKYNKETGEVDDLLAKRLAEGVYRHDPENNKYYKGEVELMGYTPLYIFTSPAKARWIMEWFNLDDDAEAIEKTIYSKTDYYRKRKGDQLVVIASTYHNEHNLSPGFIDRLIKDQGGDEGRVAMLVYGSPFGKTGGEYYSSYKRLVHIKSFEPWDDEPLHSTFDFNVVPYMTALMAQLKFNTTTNRYLLRIFDEACLENPNNSTPAICKEIIRRHGPMGTKILKPGGFFYYGDYSGKNRQTLSDEYRNQYDVIEKIFAKYLNNLSDRVRPNLLHITRRDFMCNLFNGVHPVDIEIHEKCKNLSGDLEFVKVGPNGEKLKTKITVDGVSFEEHGHTSDALDYLCCSLFDNLLTIHK